MQKLMKSTVKVMDATMESRRVEEAASRRYEAAGWLRKMVGVVVAKDLPAEPSEEEFRLGLRSGIILCNVINKIQPGAMPKVVEIPIDRALIPDGARLSAFQYFENVRNFLVAIQEIGLPSFEASDLEQGGKSSRIVNSVLALKSYGEWKQTGANAAWKFGGTLKPITSGKTFVRKNSEPFSNSLSRNTSMNEKSLNALTSDVESNKMVGSHSLSTLIQAILLDKKLEEVPMVVEEFEHRIACQGEQVTQPRTASRDINVSQGNDSVTKFVLGEKKAENKIPMVTRKEEFVHKNHVADEELKSHLLKQQMLFDQQQRNIQELKHTLDTTKASMQFMQVKFHEEFSNLGMHMHGLAHAASGYHQVLEENRKLYNQVQDLKGSIRVYCRVRPFLPGKLDFLSTVEHIEDGNITINVPSKNGKGRRSFNFNKVFGPSATQAEVLSDMHPLIRSVLDGYNVCIFAYGQTGSGKTYTMTGPKEITEKSQGVNYRALGDLFFIADQRKGTFHYDVFVQMIEIYNEQVRDLLVTDGTSRRLEIRSSSQRGLSVPDVSLVPVSSTLDVIDLMNLGQRNRAVGATALNDRSSRSHSCLTVHVQGKDLTSGTILRGCMHLVDLAGSERVDKSEATGDRLKEAQHINKSLSALGDVIASLAQKNPHVPYRNSKLTQLLQDSLGGQAKTLMFVHISPETDATGETISTLKFAEKVAAVELGAARVNKDSTDVKELKEQIASLKAALARKEGDSEVMQHSLSASSVKYSNTKLRQKTQSIDFDEISANSPPWPPVNNSHGQNNGEEDDKQTGSGEWVDKVMANKQDASKAENTLGCWEAENVNGHLSDIFYQKYLQDSSKIYSERSYDMFMGGNQFNVVGSDDMDDIDAATSDSSEPGLLWQFNHSKLTGIANWSWVKDQEISPKASKKPRTEIMNSGVVPSPSRKQANGVSHLTGRHPASVDMKRKTVNRK